MSSKLFARHYVLLQYLCCCLASTSFTSVRAVCSLVWIIIRNLLRLNALVFQHTLGPASIYKKIRFDTLVEHLVILTRGFHFHANATHLLCFCGIRTPFTVRITSCIKITLVFTIGCKCSNPISALFQILRNIHYLSFVAYIHSHLLT